MQLQYPSTYTQGSPVFLGPQATVQLVTQRALEALSVQRETARRALLRQQGEFIAVTHQCDAVARRNLVSALARNSEVHS